MKRKRNFKILPTLPVLYENRSLTRDQALIQGVDQDLDMSSVEPQSESPSACSVDSGVGSDGENEDNSSESWETHLNYDINFNRLNKSKTMKKIKAQNKKGENCDSPETENEKSMNFKLRKAKMNPNRAYPDLNIPSLSKPSYGQMGHGKEGHIVPGSKIDRKTTLVRNAMYGNFLRQSTKKLQDDLRQTMRTYSTEKQQLLQHLASLRHEMDELRLSGTSSPTSTATDRSHGSETAYLHKTRRFYMAPNVAAHKLKKKKRKENGKKSQKPDSREEEKKPKEGILKLPSIQEGQNSVPLNKATSEWDSGEQISLANLPPINPPTGIAAAQALLQESFKMPNINDPERRDINMESSKSSLFKEKKKVQFADRNQITVITPSTENKKGLDEDDNVPKNLISEGSKSSPRHLKGRNHHLPPLDIAGKKSMTPRETEDHKMMYISIKDPEIRTKTLSEILHAVRIRMQENEHHMKYFGMTPPRKINNTYEFLVSSSLDQHSPSPRSDSQRSKASSRTSMGPQNTAARLGRRSNAAQLQNYLKKMSKSRRMIEHMEAEEYRLAHIMGHKELMAVSKASAPIAVNA